MRHFKEMARVTGLEPATSGVTGRRSNQLSYTRVSAWVPRLYGSSADLSTAVPRFFENGGFPGKNDCSRCKQQRRVFGQNFRTLHEIGRNPAIDGSMTNPFTAKTARHEHRSFDDAI